ncbi:MAG: S-methyl-5'-thioadenosine phosphorylase, partial [Candidatus Omnitrophica bacterium]|nr:S-methyl-5'-thioadenosine phosphorylase [Candidatus Omnitrophota bacterium]
LARNIHQAAQKTNVTVHFGGTYLNMEGPQFSTLAESNLYRAWGMDIIGMTNMVEARLAREAEICYATLAAITDYDCWHETTASVTVDMVIANLKRNVRNSQEIIKNVVRSIPQKRTCGCMDALKHAIVTQPHAIKPALKKKLKIIIGKYVS